MSEMREKLNECREFFSIWDKANLKDTYRVMGRVFIKRIGFLLTYIDKLESTLNVAKKIIDNLRDYSTGMSVLSEEKMQPLVEEWERLTNEN